ncbi:MAG: metal-dependent hydrolase [Bdellovibrionia bacterium]
MLVLGHLGIGKALVSPFIRRLKLRWIYLGTILPDLIDKPLYYCLSWVTGKQGLELGLISGSRTFGHTALFALLLSLGAFVKRSKLLAALSIGVASHLILDSFGDHFWAKEMSQNSSLLWPLNGLQMPITPFQNVFEHLGSKRHPGFLYAELIGALLLVREYFRSPGFYKEKFRKKPARSSV